MKDSAGVKSACFAGLAFCFASAAFAGDVAGDWFPLDSGLEIRRVRTTQGDSHLDLTLVRAAPDGASLRIVTEQPRGLELAKLIAQDQVLAAVNGSASDGAGCAVGWVVADGVEHSTKVRDRGVVVVVDPEKGLRAWRERYTPPELQVDQALQAGHFLVHEGFPSPYLRPGLSRRAFLGLDREGRTVLGVTETPVETVELARFLAAPEASGGGGMETIVDLGGGTATQLFLRGGGEDGADRVPTGKPRVPVAVLLEARPAGSD